MYYIHIENNKILSAGQAEVIGEGFANITVSEELFNDYIQNPNKYIYKDNEIVQNPNYETIKHQEYIKTKIEEITEKMAIIDSKRIRAVCEDEIRDEKTGETWLDYYNAQIYDLRVELNSLEAQL